MSTAPPSTPSRRSPPKDGVFGHLPAPAARIKLALFGCVATLLAIALFHLCTRFAVPTNIGMFLTLYPDAEERKGIPTALGWPLYYSVAAVAGAVSGALFGRLLLVPLTWSKWLSRPIAVVTLSMVLFSLLMPVGQLVAYATSKAQYPTDYLRSDLLPWFYQGPLLATVGCALDMGVLLPYSIGATLVLRRLIFPDVIEQQPDAKDPRPVWRRITLIPSLIILCFAISGSNFIAMLSRAGAAKRSFEYVEAGHTPLTVDSRWLSAPDPRTLLSIRRFLSASSAWWLTTREPSGYCGAPRVALRRKGTLDGIGLAGEVGVSEETGRELEVLIGLGDYATERGGVKRGYAAHPTVVSAGTSEVNLDLRKNPEIEQFASELVVVGKGIWIEIFEASPERTRTLTMKAFGGVIEELQRYASAGDFEAVHNELPPGSVIEQSGAVATEFRVDDVEKHCTSLPGTVSGFVNAKKDGYLCVTVTGDRMNHGLEWCGRNGSNFEFPGWSESDDLRFFYSFPVLLPGPLAGEAYPYRHTIRLNFVPCDGTKPLALGDITLEPCAEQRMDAKMEDAMRRLRLPFPAAGSEDQAAP